MSKVLYDMDSGVPGVRLATKADEGAIFALLRMLHRENGMFGLNPDKVIAGIQWATERKGGIIFCIDQDSRVVATLGMCIACDWYSDDEYLLERWNFVHPHYRQSDYARKLLEQGKWAHAWFKRNGKNMPFQAGINSFDRTEAKVRLYARHMVCIGAYFIYGEPPLQPWKYRDAAPKIEEVNRKVRGMPAPYNRSVVPVVETVIRASQRETGDVQ
jgi:GNAT superfamily N-acetyltransferase